MTRVDGDQGAAQLFTDLDFLGSGGDALAEIIGNLLVQAEDVFDEDVADAARQAIMQWHQLRYSVSVS